MKLRFPLLWLLCLFVFNAKNVLCADTTFIITPQIGHNAGNSGGGIQSIAPSPDGELIASATGEELSLDGELILWNAKGEVWFRTDDLGSIKHLDWSPDSQKLVISAANGLHIFERKNISFATHFSFDDDVEATDDGARRAFWLAETGKIAVQLERGSFFICDPLIQQKQPILESQTDDELRDWNVSPDGRSLAVSTAAGVLLFDAQTGKQRLLSLQISDADVDENIAFIARTFAWSPDGNLLAAYGNRQHFALWNVKQNRLLRSEKIEEIGQIERFAIDNQGQVKWFIVDREYLGRFKNGKPVLIKRQSDMAWIDDSANTLSADEKIWFAGDYFGDVVWHDARTGKVLRRFPGFNQWANAVVWSPNRKYLAVGYGRRKAYASYGEISVFDAETGALVRSLTAIHDGPDGYTGVNGVTFSPDGRYLVSNATRLSDGHFSLRFWDGISLKELRDIPIESSGAVKIGFSRDSQMMFCGTQSGEVLVWKSVTKLLQGKTTPDLTLNALATKTRATDGLVIGIGISPDKTLLIAGADGHPSRLSAWDLTSGKLRANLPIRGAVHGVVFSRDGKTFWTGDDFGDILEWDAKSLRVHRRLQIEGPSCGSLALSADGSTLLAARDNEIACFNLADGTIRRVLSGAPRPFNEIAISPGGKLIAGADESGKIHLWNTKSGEMIVRFLRLHAERNAKGNLSTRAAAITKDGFYSVNPQSENLLRWREGGNLITASELREKHSRTFNNPMALQSAQTP